MSEHPSAIILERHAVGDLPPDHQQEIALHVEACAACRAVVVELGVEQDARLAAVSVERFVGQVAARRDLDANLARRRRGAWIASGAATLMTAVAAMMLLIPRTDTRLKGAGFTVQRSRGGVVRALAATDGIRAGDALRLVVTLPRPTRVAAWSVDAHGRVDHLSSSSVTMERGEHALPDSVIVEDPCVDLEVVVGLDDAASDATEAALQHATALPKGTLSRSLHCE